VVTYKEEPNVRKAAIVIAILALAMLVLWVVRSSGPSDLSAPHDPNAPPDLSQCTRLGVERVYDVMSGFTQSEVGLFNTKEKEYVRSCKTWVIVDPNRIRLFAEAVSRGTFERQLPGKPWPRNGFEVACYSGGRLITSLELDDGLLFTENGGVFRYPEIVLNRSMLDPPGIAKLRSRWFCGLFIELLDPRAILRGEPGSPYPAPTRWCDAFVESLRQRRAVVNGTVVRDETDAEIAARFRCPTKKKPIDPNEYLKPADVIREDDIKQINEPVREWVSDYAMNPNCEPNSPKDTVLLFETKPGWNQHGGPELFNFDNHDPKGGCVLLNGGNVKFIRTKEELAQLRWKQ
jgi:hypothetical protein